PESLYALRGVCDEVISLYAPEYFMAVGTFYDNFRHVPDNEVSDLLALALDAAKVPAGGRGAEPASPGAPSECGKAGPEQGPSEPGSTTKTAGPPASLAPRDEHVSLEVADATIRLDGHLTVPPNAIGTVIFVHGSGSSRHSPRNTYVATQLNEAGLG